MNLLNRWILFMAKEKGFATIVALALIVGAFGIGIYFEKFTKEIDHPVEQAAEEILEDYGIDIDFSEEKKSHKSKQ